MRIVTDGPEERPRAASMVSITMGVKVEAQADETDQAEGSPEKTGFLTLMFKTSLVRMAAIRIIALFSPMMALAETVGVFYDPAVEPSRFAAADVKAALEHKNFTVEMVPLSSLAATYARARSPRFWRARVGASQRVWATRLMVCAPRPPRKNPIGRSAGA
jgi:hypothetical protein